MHKFTDYFIFWAKFFALILKLQHIATGSVTTAIMNREKCKGSHQV